ncbi:hypothetical protein AB0L83_34725 [Streptomyces sp. NPDC052071]|uniref:Uncharacterized protein n=1 Tax=Streptomyces pratensis (strain ATCC 33331 / IAF-45CD) TaxID=591167 RepID=A0A8D3WMQ0_STRFA
MDQEAMRSAVVGALSDVEAVKEKLTGLLAEIDGTASSVSIPRQGLWTKEQVGLLWGRASHLTGVHALFQTTAEQAGTTVTFTSLIERSGLDERQQRNEHARLSRLASELFGEKRWPIENWQGGYNTHSGKSEMLYRMDPQIAEWWLTLVD